MKSKYPPITEWKLRLIRQDIEMYNMGQITLKEIAINRKVSYGAVIKIASSMIDEQLIGYKKTDKFR